MIYLQNVILITKTEVEDLLKYLNLKKKYIYTYIVLFQIKNSLRFYSFQ